MARVYLPDIATRNVRPILKTFPGFVHAPELIHAEATAAWLQAVREGRVRWDEYEALLDQFVGDIASGRLVLWRDDGLLPAVLSVQERVTRMHMEDPYNMPILHTHDAYYVALAEVLRRDTGERVILVTNDARVWRCGQVLGLEVFHGNTCDLGRQRLNVGAPGQDFPEGANCSPCSHLTCPSGFTMDLAAILPHLGSGTPRSQRERAARTESATSSP